MKHLIAAAMATLFVGIFASQAGAHDSGRAHRHGDRTAEVDKRSCNDTGCRSQSRRHRTDNSSAGRNLRSGRGEAGWRNRRSQRDQRQFLTRSERRHGNWARMWQRGYGYRNTRSRTDWRQPPRLSKWRASRRWHRRARQRRWAWRNRWYR